MDWAKTAARRDENHLSFGSSASYIRYFRRCSNYTFILDLTPGSNGYEVKRSEMDQGS